MPRFCKKCKFFQIFRNRSFKFSTLFKKVTEVCLEISRDEKLHDAIRNKALIRIATLVRLGKQVDLLHLIATYRYSLLLIATHCYSVITEF
jgi:hypothetical protein